MTIRKATPDDLPEIQRLLSEAADRGEAQQVPPRRPGRTHLLVVDAPDGNGLAAAALLVLQGASGKLAMLVVDRRYEALGLAQRLVHIAENLCKAFGVRQFNVAVQHTP